TNKLRVAGAPGLPTGGTWTAEPFPGVRPGHRARHDHPGLCSPRACAQGRWPPPDEPCGLSRARRNSGRAVFRQSASQHPELERAVLWRGAEDVNLAAQAAALERDRLRAWGEARIGLPLASHQCSRTDARIDALGPAGNFDHFDVRPLGRELQLVAVDGKAGKNLDMHLDLLSGAGQIEAECFIRVGNRLRAGTEGEGREGK